MTLHRIPNISEKRAQLALLALAQLLAMALWFSASAVAPQLAAEWNLDDAGRAWMTMGVQGGFVIGALVSAVLNLPDRLPPRYLFAGCALAGALANAAIPLVASPAPALILRFFTGAALAGVYPPGMKLMATWCREDRGLGIGILVGALTLGSAVPHLLNALVPGGVLPPWRTVLFLTSALAVIAAVLAARLVRPGPYLTRSAPFHWRFAARALTDRPTRLANFGYLGHMWELYAMWAWIPFLLQESYRAAGWELRWAFLAAFGVIGVGAGGCVLAGLAADRLGRTRVTIWSLAVSGTCALGAGFLFSSPGWLTLVCLVWGFAVVADSGQFSAAVSELTDPRYVGTALTVQTCMGFLLTLFTIRLVPPLVEAVGWPLALAVLALGPAFGIRSMLALRRMPESSRMAGGRR